MIADFFIMIINFFITLICGVITWIVNILPTSPFKNLSLEIPTKYLGYINYIIPLNLIIPVLLGWAAVMVGYKFLKWILHIIKLE